MTRESGLATECLVCCIASQTKLCYQKERHRDCKLSTETPGYHSPALDCTVLPSQREAIHWGKVGQPQATHGARDTDLAFMSIVDILKVK